VALLVQRYGVHAQAFIEKRLGLVVSGIALAVVGAFLVWRFAT
jgi:hypothetical protein